MHKLLYYITKILCDLYKHSIKKDTFKTLLQFQRKQTTSVIPDFLSFFFARYQKNKNNQINQ